MTAERETLQCCVRGMYFSGTGTTEKIVTAVAEVISRSDDAIFRVPDIDFTPPAARNREYSFGPRDVVVFGVPVIAGRVPNVLLPFLEKIEGGGAMAIPVVLYGNRNFDDALIELRNILEADGFHTVAAGAFIGEHSFSRILAAGRPDEKDMDAAIAFAKAGAARIRSLLDQATDMAAGAGTPVAESEGSADSEGPLPAGAIGAEGAPAEARTDDMITDAPAEADPMIILDRLLTAAGPIPVDGQDPIRPYYKPQDRQGNHINILKVKPKLDESKCTGCGTCVAACPMGSIKWDRPVVKVEGICIKCCGCEKKCPEGAWYFDDPGYLYHKEELELGYPERKEPKVFL